MARNFVTSVPGYQVPDADYPNGRVVNVSQGIEGTAVVEELFGDYIQFLERVYVQSGFPAKNGAPDNDANGYQYYEAFLRWMQIRMFSDSSLLKARGGSVAVNGTNLNFTFGTILGGTIIPSILDNGGEIIDIPSDIVYTVNIDAINKGQSIEIVFRAAPGALVFAVSLDFSALGQIYYNKDQSNLWNGSVMSLDNVSLAYYKLSIFASEYSGSEILFVDIVEWVN